MRRQPRLSSLLSNVLVGSGFVPVWLATGALFVVAALAEMLVVMAGGIDLSIPGVVTLVGNLVVGVGAGSNGNLWLAILACIGWSALVGLVNGLLIGVIGL